MAAAGERASLKVLHVVYSYPPDPPGGTEIVVANLAKIEAAAGVEVCVAAPAGRTESYRHEGVLVHRFAMSADLDLPALYGEGDEVAAENFAAILSRLRPDIVNFHAWTPAVSLRTVREAQRQGSATVFCYHTPAASCARGTLLLHGKKPCDGVLDQRRCTTCFLESRGMPSWAAQLTSNLPAALGLAANGIVPRRVSTVLRAGESIGRLHTKFRELLRTVDRVVAPCYWVRDLLQANGLAASKITVCRQGAGQPDPAPAVLSREPSTNTRIAYFGRAHAAKGIGTLIEALSLTAPSGPGLDVFAVAQSAGERQAIASWKASYAANRRIRFLDAVGPEAVLGVLAAYDYLAVPSETLETGPLVVHEAIAARVPVLGSNLGGIAELIHHDVNGLMVEPGNVKAWVSALNRVSGDRSLRDRLASQLPRPRTFQDMAGEFRSLYEHLCAARIPGARA